jgi:hypothetical protein
MLPLVKVFLKAGLRIEVSGRLARDPARNGDKSLSDTRDQSPGTPMTQCHSRPEFTVRKFR